MKKNIYFLLICLFMTPFVFTSCDDDDDDEVVIDPGVEITLEENEVVIGAGQIISVNILTGNGGYQVTSQNQDVVLASLSEEKMITLKAASTEYATGTVLIKDNKGREKELTVNVIPAPVEPVGLRLSKAELTLAIGKPTETIEVKIISGNSGYRIEYVEDAAEFITINSEKIETEGRFTVTGVVEGFATIKVIDSQAKEAVLPITIYLPPEDHPLHITGEGSEDGQLLKEIETNVFEIYTKIEADQPFYFSSTLDEEVTVVSLNSDNSSLSVTTNPEGPIEGATLPETSVYRIKLNFNTNAVSIEQVGDVSINVSSGGRDTKFEYYAKGVWKLDNYNVQIRNESWGIEERYRIIFTVDGIKEYWGRKAGHGNRPSVTEEGYRDMKIISNNAYDSAVFKFPNELCDSNNTSRYYTDVTISMTAERNYTHDFYNIRE